MFSASRLIKRAPRIDGENGFAHSQPSTVEFIAGVADSGRSHDRAHQGRAEEPAAIVYIEQLLFKNEFPEKEVVSFCKKGFFYVTTGIRESFHTGPSGYWYASKVSESISVLYPGFSGSR
jgi:hypothetical protein